MEIITDINPKDFQVGVIVARYQIDNLHDGHKELIDYVFENHKKVIIFLGVSRSQGTMKNPLDFATRKAMVQKDYPSAIILPQLDQEDDEFWSKKLDEQIGLVYGNKPALLYGSRDSFIPHYFGKHKTVELSDTVPLNATSIREEIAREVMESSKFRRGVIYSVYSRFANPFPTIDVCAYNDKGEILLARKPGKKTFGFVGGFVDVGENLETAARREFSEETGGCEVQNLRYMFSKAVNDWRYPKGSGNGITTTLFLGKFGWGNATPTDDIEELKWVHISRYSNPNKIKGEISEVHQEMMKELVEKVYNEGLIYGLDESTFYKEPNEMVDPYKVKPPKFEIKI